MKDLAPEIVRQRLLIEGIYSIEVNREIVESFLLALLHISICELMDLRLSTHLVVSVRRKMKDLMRLFHL